MPRLPKIRFRQFSLRTGAILFLAVAIAFGLIGRWIQSVRERSEAQLWLVAQSNDGPPSPGEDYRSRLIAYYAPNEKPSWFVRLVRDWVHPEYDRKLEHLTLGLDYCSKEHLQRAAMLFNLEHLVIRGEVDASSLDHVFRTPGLKKLYLHCKVTDSSAANNWPGVKRAKTLEWFELDDDRGLPDSLIEEVLKLPTIYRTRMSCDQTENLTALSKAPNATIVQFFGNELNWMFTRSPRANRPQTRQPTPAPSKEVFDELAKNPKLDQLMLLYIEMDDPAAIEEFCEQSNVTVVRGLHIRISPECLPQIAKLKRLTTLDLGRETLTEDHVRVLKTMTRLKSLSIGKGMPAELFDELQKALPNCTIGKM